MLIYNIHRERKFPITNLAALFLKLFESPLYKSAVQILFSKLLLIHRKKMLPLNSMRNDIVNILVTT